MINLVFLFISSLWLFEGTLSKNVPVLYFKLYCYKSKEIFLTKKNLCKSFENPQCNLTFHICISDQPIYGQLNETNCRIKKKILEYKYNSNDCAKPQNTRKKNVGTIKTILFDTPIEDYAVKIFVKIDVKYENGDNLVVIERFSTNHNMTKYSRRGQYDILTMTQSSEFKIGFLVACRNEDGKNDCLDECQDSSFNRDNCLRNHKLQCPFCHSNLCLNKPCNNVSNVMSHRNSSGNLCQSQACEDNLRYCTSKSCFHGHCENGPDNNTYHCVCPSDYEGNRCEIGPKDNTGTIALVLSCIAILILICIVIGIVMFIRNKNIILSRQNHALPEIPSFPDDPPTIRKDLSGDTRKSIHSGIITIEDKNSIYLSNINSTSFKISIPSSPDFSPNVMELNDIVNTPTTSEQISFQDSTAITSSNGKPKSNSCSKASLQDLNVYEDIDNEYMSPIKINITCPRTNSILSTSHEILPKRIPKKPSIINRYFSK